MDDARDQQVLDDIKEFGWHVVKILADKKGPGFAFSIGLFHNYQHPEIIAFGLDLDLLHKMINTIGQDVKNGKKYEPQKAYNNILDKYDCEFRLVPTRWYKEYLGYALWFYKDREFPTIQCFWPDKKQYFPWESEFTESLKGFQPLLYQY